MIQMKALLKERRMLIESNIVNIVQEMGKIQSGIECS